MTLHITDDGIGLKAEDHLKGFGLRGMRERVQALGGQFQLHSECKQSNVSTHGTRLTVILPNL